MSLLPTNSAERKAIPLCTGLLDYFPSALVAVAAHSQRSNDQHNPGEPLHWARDKSNDHLDALLRHLLERDLVGVAWRALAALQIECESKGAPMARNATAAQRYGELIPHEMAAAMLRDRVMESDPDAAGVEHAP